MAITIISSPNVLMVCKAAAPLLSPFTIFSSEGVFTFGPVFTFATGPACQGAMQLSGKMVFFPLMVVSVSEPSFFGYMVIVQKHVGHVTSLKLIELQGEPLLLCS